MAIILKSSTRFYFASPFPLDQTVKKLKERAREAPLPAPALVMTSEYGKRRAEAMTSKYVKPEAGQDVATPPSSASERALNLSFFWPKPRHYSGKKTTKYRHSEVKLIRRIFLFSLPSFTTFFWRSFVVFLTFGTRQKNDKLMGSRSTRVPIPRPGQ